MRELLAKYKNGNYFVKLFSDGTKIKCTSDNVFNADFPDSIDLKITNYCENSCPMCHESSGLTGKAGNLNHQIIDSFIPGMEVAIGGGNPLTHPNLIPFLTHLKTKGIIANITINAIDLNKYYELVLSLINNNLVHGIGISCLKYNEDAISFAQNHDNVVLHYINGVFPTEDYKKAFGKNLKILILGYKDFGKGHDFYSPIVKNTMEQTAEMLEDILKGFSVVSFDNLALEQLQVKNIISESLYNKIYMGNDGEASMYVDLVEESFAVSSTSKNRFPLKPTLIDCFLFLKHSI